MAGGFFGKSKSNTDLNKVMEFIQVLLSYHTDDSKLHSSHVMQYTRLMCLKYNDIFEEKIDRDDIDFICQGASMHDIGKISIPDEVLYKDTSLTTDEFDEIKQHTIRGAQIADRMAGIYHLTDHERNILHNICLYHHERYDGTGYPKGLKGDEIPLEAQIVSILGIYDSLVQEGYTEARTHEEACRMIMNGECGSFNPRVLTCFECIETDLKLISSTTQDDKVKLLTGVYSKNRKYYWCVKRCFDFIISLTAFIILLPFLAIVALIIFIDDPHGSPIFTQTRLGRHKKPFKLYKFRTMVVNAEALKKELEAKNEKDGPVFKITNDPRITRVGRILRKTSIDELPQLVNVIKGDMSIVGPRPPLPSEVEKYSLYQEVRLAVTPGLTCIWQTRPNRDDIKFDSWVDMDIGYIGTRCLSLDAKLIVMTVIVMLKRSGH